MSFFLWLLLLFAYPAHSTSCADLNQFWTYAMDPRLQNDASFWNEVTSLQKANMPAERYMDLLKRRGLDVNAPPSGERPALQLTSQASSAPSVLRHEFTREASKDLERLSPNLRSDLDEFIELTSVKGDFMKPLYDNPGRWQLKKLNQMGGLYSVRLNHAYRVIFGLTESKKIVIKAISRTLSHGGH